MKSLTRHKLEVIESWSIWRYWLYRALISYRLKYRDSALGLLWPVLSLLAVSLVIGAVWSVLLSEADLPTYFAYLICGYPVWGVISATIEQGCRVIESDTSKGIPFFAQILERVSMVFFPFLSVLPVMILVAAFYSTLTVFSLGYIITAVVLMLMWSIGMISMLVAMVSVFPDLRHLLNAVMRLAFLATPIIWEVGRLGEYQKYIYLNPFFIPLECLRSAFVGTSLDIVHLFFFFSIYALLALGLGLIVLKLRVKEIAK